MQQNNEQSGMRYFKEKKGVYMTKRRNNIISFMWASLFVIPLIFLLWEDFDRLSFEQSVFAHLFLVVSPICFIFFCWKGMKQIVIDPIRMIAAVRYPFYRREYDLNDFTRLHTYRERKTRRYYPWIVEMKFKGHELITVFEDDAEKRLERKKAELTRVLQLIQVIK